MMRSMLKGALTAALLAGSSLAATAPAEAHDRGGTAVIAGLIGLGIGAAIASDHHHRDRDRGYRTYAYDSGPDHYAPAYGYDDDRSYHSDRRYRDRGDWNRRGWDDRDYYRR